ncbi:50S ribosomal protein L17 [Candidatus Uhrbacteria bacterium CG22_combo_CG10-13_8_21_14_all_47_17]|uniref:Large ribosomal subunit protein bL17 n=1 Tax=Candidatus Uhrbacteria bacterium CG22_combo_CG10-13_8_21_14_all_47_17 TaxID=1975041 RepID=A0A2H0BT96_9BACT|nr:MAG: 50S ribosomal protein L17 [Candidatus Uhrbacteria bacterium CG22_combo_CG10-13_8_21_14_all_47_17]
MRHRNKTKTLGRTAKPRKALMRNLATSIILYEHVNTTLAKAKAVRPIVEKLITKGRAKSLHARRELMKDLMTEPAVLKVLEELGPRYATRPGGYTRIIKLGKRKGDGAEIAQIQLLK